MGKNNITIFVYGTLKRGWGNYSNYLKPTADFVGEAVSAEAAYSMGTVGFPILFDGGTARVKGELFACNAEALEGCDRLEGHPRMYKRMRRNFKTLGPVPQTVAAWVYIYQGEPGSGAPILPNEDGLLIWTGYSGEPGRRSRR